MGKRGEERDKDRKRKRERERKRERKRMIKKLEREGRKQFHPLLRCPVGSLWKPNERRHPATTRFQ